MRAWCWIHTNDELEFIVLCKQKMPLKAFPGSWNITQTLIQPDNVHDEALLVKRAIEHNFVRDCQTVSLLQICINQHWKWNLTFKMFLVHEWTSDSWFCVEWEAGNTRVVGSSDAQYLEGKGSGYFTMVAWTHRLLLLEQSKEEALRSSYNLRS